MSKKNAESQGELLKEALVPVEEQPYEVPGNWVWVNTGLCIDIERGITFPASAKNHTPETGLIGCARTSNIQEEFIWDDMIYVDTDFYKGNPNKLVRQDDILMSSANSYHLVGKVSYIHELKAEITFGGFLLCIRANKINSKYLYYFLRNQFFSGVFQKLSSQTTNIANINAAKIESMPFPLPPLNEQKRIADKVERLLDKINQAKQLIEEAKATFELRRAAILDKAFRGELTQQWREENPNLEDAEVYINRIKYKQEQEYNDQCILNQKLDMKKPKKRDRKTLNDKKPNYNLPNKWRWVELGELITDLTDYHANGSYEILKDNVTLLDTEDYAVMIRATNFEKQNFSTNLKYISESAYNFLAKSKLYGGEILISKIGNAGSVYLMSNLNRPASLAMNLFALRIDQDVDNEYVYYYLNSPCGKALINRYVRGVTATSIDKISVRSIWIPLPAIEEQIKIKNLIISLLNKEEQIYTIVGNSEYLNTLEKSILTNAFNGNLGTNVESEKNLFIID